MTPEQARWQLLKLLYEEALAKSQPDRAEFLRELATRDPQNAADLADLLRAHDQGSSPLDEPLVRFNPPTPQSLFQDGQIVLDRFEIIRFLGAGGMGEVYEANDSQMGRVALKTVRRDIVSNEQLFTRLRKEAQLARQISSPFVCRVYELFLLPRSVDSSGGAFITMEFLQGVTLSQKIKESGALSWKNAREFTLQICSGLDAIHKAGVVHRDIKTSNIILAQRSGATQAVVMDFGLARQSFAVSAATASGSNLTYSGAIVGTPEYMAPEQFQGSGVSPATDIYSFGIVIYEMLTAAHPFAASTPMGAAVQRARRLQPASSIQTGIPHHIDNVIRRCLDFDPERRFQSALDVERSLRHRALSPALTSGLSSPWAWKTAAALLCAAILAVVGFKITHKTYTPNAQSLYWFDKGVAALHEGALVGSTNALQEAIRHDPGFALAHARLAQAWAELDFAGKARQELVVAEDPRLLNQLSGPDKDYFEAIRSYIAEDYENAARELSLILEKLPDREKANGHLDLGRAQERAGHIPEALASYSAAVSEAPESPAPLVRRAVLESRNGSAAADGDFTKAESLYRISNNSEGLAEIDYQRGYAASNSLKLSAARELLSNSLRIASEIASPQLEIRALSRLAVVAYGEDKLDEAKKLANQAIESAHEKGLDYWAIEAHIRLANADSAGGDIANAQAQLRTALQMAQEEKVPRLVALAHFSFASLLDQQDDAEGTISHAQAALEFYKKQGFAKEYLNNLSLLIRGKSAKAQFQEALKLAPQALDLAHQSNNPASIYQIEEAVGTDYAASQDYPKALQHFEAALAASKQINFQVEYELAHCGDILWRLGRYDEAKSTISSIPPTSLKDPRIAFGVTMTGAQRSLSSQDLRKAYSLAQTAVKIAQPLPGSLLAEAELIAAQTASEFGSPKEALTFCQKARDLSKKWDDQELDSRINLANATILTKLGKWSDAKPLAQSTLQYATNTDQFESKWRSLFVLANIATKQSDASEARNYAQKSLDIFSQLEHNWGSTAYTSYISRPDVKTAREELSALTRR